MSGYAALCLVAIAIAVIVPCVLYVLCSRAADKIIAESRASRPTPLDRAHGVEVIS